MLTVYEFKLNYTKTQHSGHFRHTCTSTPWNYTDTGCILLACTGTGWPLVGCTSTALYLYRYTLGKLPRFASFCHFWYHFISYNFYNSYTSRIYMEIISKHSIILVFVVWNSYHKTLGKNPMNSPKGPSILLKTI